jgi:hypothetical protein
MQVSTCSSLTGHSGKPGHAATAAVPERSTQLFNITSDSERTIPKADIMRGLCKLNSKCIQRLADQPVFMNIEFMQCRRYEYLRCLVHAVYEAYM